MKKDLTYYQGLGYRRRIQLVTEDEGVPFWVATFEELPGCLSDGETRSEAILHLNEAFDEFITAHLEWRKPIPEPDRIVRARGRFRKYWDQKDTSSGPKSKVEMPRTDPLVRT